MRRIRSALFLILLIFVNAVCLTFSVASVSADDVVLITVQNESDGILIPADGQEWYRVNRFEDNQSYILSVRNPAGQQMMLAAADDASKYIWYYSRSNMTTSTAPRISTLSYGRYSLSYSSRGLATHSSYYQDGDSAWDYDGKLLSYHGGSSVFYLQYKPESDVQLTFTRNPAEASEIIAYSRGETLSRCIIRQPAAESYVTEGSGYPAPEFYVGLSDVTADRIEWFVNGRRQSCTAQSFTAEMLANQPAGVHRVQCRVEAHDSRGLHYREQSAEATFVIAKGVIPDSVLTFSDIHEEYFLIGQAFERVLAETGGYLPALVICTGDFVYGPTVDRDTELNRYFPQIVSQLGGLDAVFVAGNHDSGEAASVMSAAANLGAAKNLPAKGGVIFDGESEAVKKNGKSSRNAAGIIVYGINFDAAIQKNGSNVLYTYQNVIGDVKHFLETVAADYHGELVVISAHSGMHVIGMQPESRSYYQTPLSEWLGENMYNVDLSYELAQTINRYADDMDIMFLFGHDHSRNEAEMLLTDGDTLISPRHYANRSSESQTLHFTYAHAGYLSSVIGCADHAFTFLYRNGDSFSLDLLRTTDQRVRHTDIPVKHPYEAPAAAETTAATTAQTAAVSAEELQTTTVSAAAVQTTAPAEKTDGLHTGDDLYILLAASAIPVLLLILSRKRRLQ